MKYFFVLFLLPVLVLPAFADQFQLPTDKGTLLVSLTTEPTKPILGDLTKLKINFINPKTNEIQQHVDYQVTVTKDGNSVFGPIPLTHTSEGAITIPVEFKENGEHKITVDIEGLLFQQIPPETVTFTEVIGDASAQTPSGTEGNSKKVGSCIIATAAYGSELAPQVQLLREVRDNVLFNTGSGTSFMSVFNAFYYSFSPPVADLERQDPIFKEAVKLTITPMLSTLAILNYVDINSEGDMLGYGIGIILLNVGMYFVVPVIIISKIRNFRK
jgi:hypothetical protein